MKKLHFWGKKEKLTMPVRSAARTLTATRAISAGLRQVAIGLSAPS